MMKYAGNDARGDQEEAISGQRSMLPSREIPRQAACVDLARLMARPGVSS
jgi:hypothetical protein